ncbi:MAG: HEAT repeat domain-containing protein, partial [Gammaproteobacteria bacterium]
KCSFMIMPKDGNGIVRLCISAWTVLVLTGCSDPYEQSIGFSDLENSNTAIRIMAIKWAGDNKVSSAVPRLVVFLQDEDAAVRFYAIEALRRITGTDNGYDYKSNPRLRAKAVEQWRKFLKSNGSQNHEN